MMPGLVVLLLLPTVALALEILNPSGRTGGETAGRAA